MANQVIKKDGSREPFDPEKIKNSIRKAAQEAGLEESRVNELVEQVSKAAIELCDSKEEIATSEIREKILSELDNVEPSVSETWRKYEETKGSDTGQAEAETKVQGSEEAGQGEEVTQEVETGGEETEEEESGEEKNPVA